MAELPGYWMHETSGGLRPAVEAYLAGDPMTDEQIAAMRAYLRQYIASPVWDSNPYAAPQEHAHLQFLRESIDELTSRIAILGWLVEADRIGIDPL
jgi:hypothetical protein